MTKELTTQVDYPVDVETAWAALTAEDWTGRLAAEVGSTNTLTSRTEQGGEVVLVVSRSLPDGLPGALKKLIPAGARPTQTDRWEAAARDGVRHGTWTVTSPGVPADVGGVMRLEPSGSGSRLVTDVEVKVRMPVIGGRIEGILVDLTNKQAGEEGAAAARLLGA